MTIYLNLNNDIIQAKLMKKKRTLTNDVRGRIEPIKSY